MKKTLLALAVISTGLASVPVFAQNAPDSAKSGWFVGGNIGQAYVSQGRYDGHDTAYAIDGGYRWSVAPNAALGFEAGYNDLGNIKLSNSLSAVSVVANPKSKLHGWTVGVNGHINITPNWYVSARTGIYQWKGEGLSNDANPLFRSLDKTDFYAGAGFGYDFSDHVSLGLNYDYYHAKKDRVDLSTNMVSVSAEYRF
jgi:OOP family OmpA-OmpF porin/outer membrane immunogenic protein